MAKIFLTQKWKRRAMTAFSVALAASLSLGMLSACATPETEEEEKSKVAPTDTQIIKNGNFEFYSDKLVDPDENGKPLKKLNIISSPDNWTFSSGSPASEKQSGVIDTADWAYYAASGGSSAITEYVKGEETVKTFADIQSAYTHWEDADVTAYDRLNFLEIYDEEIDDLDSASNEAKLFREYSYNIDFDDVETLAADLDKAASGGELDLHAGVDTENGNTSVLMIHNSKTSDDGIRGTGQSYTSSTTITLNAGTSAKVSVWVRTDDLVHYKDVELTARGGAYIGVTNTVGGTTQDQMLIENIHTGGEWQQYTLYIRASTFATSTFRIVLGLGQSSTDDKYFAVDGYAFFDDVVCEIMPNSDFEAAVFDGNSPKSGIGFCTVDSDADAKRFDYDKFSVAGVNDSKTFALDLYAGFDGAEDLLNGVTDAALTEEVSGSNTYTSGRIDSSLGVSENDFAKLADNYAAIETAAASNPYLKKAFDSAFQDYPFDSDKPVAMLLSSNGAAYTLKLKEKRLEKDSRMLVSFFVKTNDTPADLTGAGALVMDGENGSKTAISKLNSHNVATVDIDPKVEAKKDIYKGWVQCFFFVENDTETAKTFHIELTFGPTTIVGTDRFDYCDGFAAFANFETKVLSKTEYSYASTGDYAKKVSLTGEVEETKNFDSVSATAEKDLESGPALPANYREVLGGSDYVQKNPDDDKKPNVRPTGVTAGLLNAKYSKNYFTGSEAWKQVLSTAAGSVSGAEEWWSNLFGNARQPLVIIHEASADPVSYGYFGETANISENSYQRISMRVKVSANATAHIYLTDVSAEKSGDLIYPDLPAYTYWYDDDGNIVNMDPSDDAFDKEGETLYELQPNGLYRRASGGDAYYANLSNYDTDAEGNLVAKDGTVAFYGKDGKYYAYYDEDTDTYSTEVADLHTDSSLPIRYNYSDPSLLKGTEIVVKGEETPRWVTVNFYVHTGNESKSYRLEVWSGSRDGQATNPAGSYVFFDNYASADASSDYDTYLGDTVAAIKDEYNESHGLKLGDEGYLGKNDNLPAEYAKYYTFTFYDAASYLRYDQTTDTEDAGNPWIDYTQSGYEESIVSLYYEEGTDPASGIMPRYSFFLDYSPIDVTVEAAASDADEDTDTDTDSEEPGDSANFWLLLSSGLLAIVLILVIVIVIVRRLVVRFSKKQAKVRPVKRKKDNSDPEKS